MPRLICGSNAMLGFSHISGARDRFIREYFDTPVKLAKVVEVFAKAGCNAFLSGPNDFVRQALDIVEQKVGKKIIWFSTPGVPNLEEWKKAVDTCVRQKATFCMPHQGTTDSRLDRIKQCLNPELTEFLSIVRKAGMIPGLSTHTPEAIVFSDKSGADVETYIQPYNAAGFLCQVETDWLAKIIQEAKKPVLTIKPLASGKLLPPTGFEFVWSTIRKCDMVCVGAMNVYEAEEDIEISLACLEKRKANVELQFTRSKRVLMKEKR
jgi:hypothetical protein